MSSTQPRYRWKLWLLMFSIIASAAGLWAYNNFRHAQLAAAAKPSMLPQRTHVYALGRLEPAGTILKLSPKSGNEGAIVEQILVREGDDVEAGAILAILDNQARRAAALLEAQSRLEAAEARLMQVKSGAKAGDIEAQQAAVLLADAQSKVAARELARAQELQQKKAVSSEQVDEKQWEFDRLQLEKRRASGMLESLREVRDVDVRVAEKEVSAAGAAVTRAEAESDASELRAPRAGRVLRIHTHPGERISDRGILELGNVRQMQAVAEVFESDVRLLTVGMETEVRIDAFHEPLTGRVVEIGNLVARKIVLTNDPVSDTDARVIEVRVQLNSEHLDDVCRLSNARVEVSIRLQSPNLESRENREDVIETVSEKRVR